MFRSQHALEMVKLKEYNESGVLLTTFTESEGRLYRVTEEDIGAKSADQVGYVSAS
jgi:hypothetical protein